MLLKLINLFKNILFLETFILIDEFHFSNRKIGNLFPKNAYFLLQFSLLFFHF